MYVSGALEGNEGCAGCGVSEGPEGLFPEVKMSRTGKASQCSDEASVGRKPSLVARCSDRARAQSGQDSP